MDRCFIDGVPLWVLPFNMKEKIGQELIYQLTLISGVDVQKPAKFSSMAILVFDCLFFAG